MDLNADQDWIDSYFQKDPKTIDRDQLRKLQDAQKHKFSQEIHLKTLNSLKDLPSIRPSILDFESETITIGSSKDLNGNEKEHLYLKLKSLIPWRKGPFNLFDINIDAEWKSHLKWNRLAPFLPDLKGKRILDVGCNNGYFMFKMASLLPEFVLGIDPMIPNYAQFKLLNHFANQPHLQFELWGQEDLIHFHHMFDVIFSMGIIYHHRNPIQQLLTLKKALRPGGHLILETIGINGSESHALFPEDRYAKMPNVWFVPTKSCFINWVKRAKFKNIEFLSENELTSNEQRLTSWCPPPRQSLSDFLDPMDPTKTIEGHPAPKRFLLRATA